MNIHIHSGKKLIEIQQDFQASFPFLKLEFYKHTHKEHEITSNAELINLQQTVSDLNTGTDSFDWQISDSMTVSEVENSLQEKLKIGVHVFRKSGISWLQTTTTDSWTLAQQNSKGKEMSEVLPKEEPEDYHEQE